LKNVSARVQKIYPIYIKKIILVVSALLLAISFMLFSETQAFAAEKTKQPVQATAAVDLSGIYTISTALKSGMVVDIANASTKIGAGAQLSVNNSTSSQRYKFTKNKDGSYRIKNVNSNKYLTVKGGKAKNGAVVLQYNSSTSKAQKWIVEKAPRGGKGYRISSALNKKYCLDVVGGVGKKGTKLQLYRSNGTKAQQFVFKAIKRTIANGTYVIRSAVGNKVLDVSGASVKNGANIQIWEPNNSLAQRFSLSYDTNTGYYTVTNVNAGRVMSVAGGKKTKGTNVYSYSKSKSFSKSWAISKARNGKYRITAANSGLSLYVKSSRNKNGANVQIQTKMNTKGQEWSFESGRLINEGIFEIKGIAGKNIDATGNGVSEGTRIQIYDRSETFAQKYQIKHVKSEYYTLECLNSGLVVSQNSKNRSVVLLKDNKTDYQLWRPILAGNGQFYLKNKASGLCLDVVKGGSASGTSVEVHGQHRGNAQKWSFLETDPVYEGIFTIPVAASPNKVVDVINGGSANGTKLQLYDKNGTTAQAFKFTKASGAYYRITNLNSAKALEVAGGVIDPATGQGNVRIYSVKSKNNTMQLWQVRYVGNGKFRIYSASGDGRSCLDVNGALFENGRQIQVYRENNTVAQDFLLAPFGNNVTYERVNATVNQMVLWQRAGNQYIRDESIQHMRDVINPSIAMSDYYYAKHGFTYTGGVYQFADLRSTSGLTSAQLNAIINSNALGKSGKLKGLGSAFVTAANTYGLNECYLLAHAVLESGWGTSELAKGNYYNGKTLINGKRYPKGTYYNFYGIGAYDSSPFSGGMSLAIQNGWNTPQKAVIGAAKWIARYYIYSSDYPQPTLYAMKWDYARSSDVQAYGWHQYATDHLWARKIAKLMGEMYSGRGYEPSLNYIVPQYR
jgi:beta-N-acetylglucosaminidase